MKHHDDLGNAKQIPSILPDYIPPFIGTVNRENIPCDFEYMLIIAYIPKGICIVGPQLGKIPSLKNNEFNLSDRNEWNKSAEMKRVAEEEQQSRIQR